MNKEKIILTSLRLSLGFIFAWAFFDKLLGLGFATSSDKAWIHGGSPTFGFLKFAVKGPYADFFHSLAGMAIVDWLFMAGLIFVGVTLIINKYVKWGALVGSIMLFLMYLALILPENNPILDEHLIYIMVLALIGLKNSEEK